LLRIGLSWSSRRKEKGARRRAAERARVVAIGASAGGVEALRNIAAGLPEDFGSTVFVVLHLPPGGTSVLPAILARAGDLPASHPTDGEEIKTGHIYVAPRTTTC
jgi:two-component system, chemotaxis family, protein-glutamate methylesterase/glutaminase